jgi:hypothetical protein
VYEVVMVSRVVDAGAVAYLLGVSTRRMDRLVQSLGITGLSKSQVSVMALVISTSWSATSANARSMPARTRSWPPTRDDPDLGRPLRVAG